MAPLCSGPGARPPRTDLGAWTTGSTHSLLCGILPAMTALVDAIVGLPPWLVLTLVLALPALEASVFIGLVIPGEVAVLIGGVVAHGGGLPLWAVICAATAGAAVGDQVGFLVGRRYGKGLLDRLPVRVRGSGEVDRALSLVRRRGAVAVLLGRWDLDRPRAERTGRPSSSGPLAWIDINAGLHQ